MPVLQYRDSIYYMSDTTPSAEISYIGDENVAKWAYTKQGEVVMPIGVRIKELRSEQRLSQGDLATMIGADPGQISRYENGHIAPSADAIVRLAEALDVSCDYLLIDDAPRRGFRTAIENALGESLNEVTQLNEDDLRSVQNFIDALVTRARIKAIVGA